jgi:protein TonB
MRNLSSEPKSLRFLWGGIAFLVYFGLIGLLLIYFNQRSVEKPKHFVKKDEKRIQVMETAPIKAIRVKTIVEKPVVKPKKVVPKKTEVVKPVKPKVIPKKEKVILKEKIVKKKVVKKKPLKVNKPKVKVKKEVKKPKKIEKPKKPVVKKTSDLFSSVKTEKKVTDKPKSASKQIKDKKKSDSGIENAYFAKVQSLLETWPAQSDYAGEKAMVSIYVKPTGMFEFKVKSQSDNVDFNLGLIDFLMQLQRMGLGKLDSGMTYEFKVEFIANE